MTCRACTNSSLCFALLYPLIYDAGPSSGSSISRIMIELFSLGIMPEQPPLRDNFVGSRCPLCSYVDGRLSTTNRCETVSPSLRDAFNDNRHISHQQNQRRWVFLNVMGSQYVVVFPLAGVKRR